MADWFGKEVPKLGFGMMRLPKRGVVTDIEQTKKMVDLFMQAGFTYFDTAFVYPGSEAATKKALVDRYPRESYTICTKINAMLPTATEKSVKKQFETSLQRTGAGYFDFYWLHNLNRNSYETALRTHAFDFVRNMPDGRYDTVFVDLWHDAGELHLYAVPFAGTCEVVSLIGRMKAQRLRIWLVETKQHERGAKRGMPAEVYLVCGREPSQHV